jgi:hypothetical protein
MARQDGTSGWHGNPYKHQNCKTKPSTGVRPPYVQVFEERLVANQLVVENAVNRSPKTKPNEASLAKDQGLRIWGFRFRVEAAVSDQIKLN